MFSPCGLFSLFLDGAAVLFVVFGVVLVQEGGDAPPLVKLALDGDDQAVHQGAGQALHPRLHRPVPDHDAGQTCPDVTGRTCKARYDVVVEVSVAVIPDVCLSRFHRKKSKKMIKTKKKCKNTRSSDACMVV